jgi:zinc/manganese transport system ATP-binding protein
MDIIHDIHHGNDITVIIVSHLLHVIINHVEKYVFIGNGNAIVHSIEEVIESDFLSKLYEVPISIDTVNGKRVIVMG